MESDPEKPNPKLCAEYRLKAGYLLKMAKSVPKPQADSLFAWGLHCLTSLKEETGEPTKNLILLRDASDCFKKALEVKSDHRHAGMMLADVEYFGLGATPESVLEHLKPRQSKEGNNMLHHRFVFQCLAGKWKEAAKTAAQMRGQLKNLSEKKDREIEQDLSAFEKAICIGLSDHE